VETLLPDMLTGTWAALVHPARFRATYELLLCTRGRCREARPTRDQLPISRRSEARGLARRP